MYLKLIFSILELIFKSKKDLAIEVMTLKQQLHVYKRKNKHPKIENLDRKFWIFLSKNHKDWKTLLCIVKPDTVIKWHRNLSKKYWSFKSKRKSPGRPKVDKEIRELIAKMAEENLTWGAGRVYGELLKLGYNISERTVARYMPKNRNDRSQSWKTFLQNQSDHIVSLYFFSVFTASFKQLYGLVVIDHKRRKILLTNATFNPSYDWLMKQLNNAFPGECTYKYLICDNDRKFSKIFAKDIEKIYELKLKNTSYRSPWQNGICERSIGTIRRECLDHVIILGESHLRSVLKEYEGYYNDKRTHRSLSFNSPNRFDPRVIGSKRKLISKKYCNGLHHSYDWLKCA